MKETVTAFERLLAIAAELRAKCPWDQRQTPESLRHLTIEEVYELSDAIIANDPLEMKGELGDLMFHLVFYAQIMAEKGAFDLTDVLRHIADKLVHRHPHIYGDQRATSEEEVKANWEALKLKEGRTSVLQGVPRSLPAVVKAMRIQEKARGIGFDWEEKGQVWEKVYEELREFQAAAEAGDSAQMEAEWGDLLFSLINCARWSNIDTENALEKTNQKFIQRFQWMEKAVAAEGKHMTALSQDEMNRYWEAAKSSCG